MKERHAIEGRVRIELREPGGRVVRRVDADNLITTAGRAFLAGVLAGTEQVEAKTLWIAVGGSKNPPTADDTALGEPIDIVAATSVAPKIVDNPGPPRVLATIAATLPPTNAPAAQVLQEAGILIQRPNIAPVLYNHVVFEPISRAGSLEMTLTWEVIF